jgi:hypothetical protein
VRSEKKAVRHRAARRRNKRAASSQGRKGNDEVDDVLSANRVPAVSRAAAALECIAAVSPNGRTLSELAREIGAQKSSLLMPLWSRVGVFCG